MEYTLIFMLCIIIAFFVFRILGNALICILNVNETEKNSMGFITLVLGYVLYPVFISVIHWALRFDIVVESLALVLLGIVILLAKARKGRRIPLFPKGFHKKSLLFAFLFALVCVSALLPGMMHLKVDDTYFIGTNIFDFEKHVGIVNSIASNHVPYMHFSNENVFLKYYMGFYFFPAFLSRIFPSAVVVSLTAHYFCSYFITVLCVLCMMDLAVEHKICRLFGVILLCNGTGLGVLPKAPEWLSYRLLGNITALLWTLQHQVSIYIFLFAVVLLSVTVKDCKTEVISYFLIVYAFISSAMLAVIGCIWCIVMGICHRKNILRWIQRNRSMFFLGAILFVLAIFSNYSTTIICYLHGKPGAGTPIKLVNSFQEVFVNAMMSVSYVGVFVISLAIVVLYKSKMSKKIDIELLQGFLFLDFIGIALFFNMSEISGKISCFFYVVPALVMTIFFDTMANRSYVLSISLTKEKTPKENFEKGEIDKSLNARFKVGNGWKYNIVLILTIVCSLKSLELNVQGVYTQIKYAPRGTREEIELVEYVRKNTKIDDIVSNLYDAQTVYESQLGRMACAYGVEPFPRLLANMSVETEDDLHTAYQDVLQGILQSDYIYMSKLKSGLGSYIAYPEKYETNLKLLKENGFETVFQNGAGIVAKNTKKKGG